MTKDYYKETEYLLYNYKMFQINIENMESEIEYLRKEEGMTGISYDGVNISPTYKISSMTEDVALSNSEKIHFLEHNIKYYKRQLEKIDRAMEGLTPIERQIIYDKYIEGKQWYMVAYNNNCSESTGKRYRRRAIKKLVLGIYGGRKD